MIKPLTPIAIANLKPKPQRYEISDPGCPGLRVVVFPSRRKSFVLRFRFRNLQRKLTLGPCLTERGVAESDTTPELGTPLSLAAARERATKALREAKSGRDPCAAKQRQRQEELAAESDTLSAIAAEYLRREGPRMRTVGQRKADLELLCSKLGRLRVGEITRGQFAHVLDHISDHNGPVRSDRCRSALRTLLNWHGNRSDYVSPLTRGGRKTSMAERARSRTLTDDELRAVWTAAGQDKGPFGPFVRFTLLTATRRGEGAGLRRKSELSDDGKTWTIPGSRYKTGKDVVLPLSKAAWEIIAAQPVPGGGDHVFSADGARPLGGFDARKKEFDAITGVKNYTLHDLRRTSRTLLSRAGIRPDVAELCLGHAPNGIRGTYDRFQYLDEKARAFEALAALIERIVHPPPDVVVPITGAKARLK
jgi:integrase